MLGRILIGFAISALGFLLAWKTEWFLNIIGYVDWAERWFGGGGTRLFYKLLGTAIIIIGFMVITDLFNSFIAGVIGGLFGR
ncbi:hypothetical protein HYS28_01345 [Candidatus Uhrbacteria bacterium]|nr:hypothetical protein [Candidatus Uhrbacteria bacterium]